MARRAGRGAALPSAAQLDDYLGVLGHELRTPLTAVRAALGLLEDSAGDRLRAEERALLANARRNSERLTRLVADLQLAAELRAGTLTLAREPLDLRGVAEAAAGAVEVLLRQAGQTLALALPEALPVAGDAGRLELVLLDVLANAQRHTPPGTRVTVSGHVADAHAVLTVRDSGPGIPPEQLERIFERGVSGDGGLGLGLSLARGVAGLHGGRLWAESPPEGGAAFHLALPRA
ncbi:MAG TPA: HAMP domain-containing sensor histidine kinase [Vicinamibacteria bacterium]